MSYPPYLFECLLYAAVDEKRGSAQVGNGAVVFKLHKQEAALWGRLQPAESGKVFYETFCFFLYGSMCA